MRGTQPDFLAKVMPQRGWRPEAAALRDVIDGKRGVFEQFTRCSDSSSDNPIRWAAACCCAKPPHERALAHGREARQLRDAPALAGPIPDFIEQYRKRPALFRAASTIFDGPLQELRLAALTMRRNDQPARYLIRYLRTIVASNQMQAEVESRGAAGGGENAALIYVKNIRIDTNLGKSALQRLGIAPVSGRAPAIEQSGCRKHECTRTDGQNPRTPLMRAPQSLEYFVRHRYVDARPSRDHDCAGGGQTLQAVCRLHPHAVLRSDARALERAGLEAVPTRPQFRSRQPEHFSGAGKFKSA